jgi:putative transport protein
MNVDMNLAIGVFAGAMTSTPGLAVAQETTHSALSSTGYGLVYPIGVIGVILFIRLLPKIFRVKIEDEEQKIKLEDKKCRGKVASRCAVITNREIDGKTLRELNFEQITGTIMSRIMQNGEVIVPNDKTVLHVNDVVRLVGAENKIKTAIPFLGHETDMQFTETARFESRKFVLTNPKIVGKKISDLNLRAYYNVNITRIRRGGMEFTAEPNQTLVWGDRLRVAGDASQMDKIAKFFGDEMKKLQQGDIFSIILGILLGILAGLVPFSIGKVVSFNLGLTGGILLAGLFLSNRGKIGPIIWQVPVSIINFMRELGVTFFLAVVGIKAGSQVMQIFGDEGLKLLLFGALITLIPMIIMALVARFKYKIMIVELVGLISGGMTSTPGLASAMEITESQKPLVVYATIYPVAMLLMMIFVRILALLS